MSQVIHFNLMCRVFHKVNFRKVMVGLALMLFTICTQAQTESSKQTQWPQWLGKELQPTANSHWKAEVANDSVLYAPAKALPKVLVIVSRKATSYDIALKTLLSEFSRALPQAQWVVKKLPATPNEISSMLQRFEGDVSLVYTLGSRATVEVRKVYKGGKLPVISVNAKDPVQLGLIDQYSGSGDNFAFTSLNLPAEVVLNFIQRFKPTLKSIGILYANTNRSAYLTQFLPLQKVAQQAGIKIVPIAVDENEAELKLDVAMPRAIKTLKQGDPQLAHSVLWLTGSSSLLSRVDEINQHSEQLALISAVPDVVNETEHSALMSFGVSFVNNAHQAAIYGLKVIKGEIEVGQLPVGVISPPDIAISFQQAKRIRQQVPFVLMEMASDVYGVNGTVIRLNGKPVKEQK